MDGGFERGKNYHGLLSTLIEAAKKKVFKKSDEGVKGFLLPIS